MMKRNDIERIANDVLNRYNITSAPFEHISEICKGEDIYLQKANFSSYMDGAFSVIQNQKFIFYNPQAIDGRQNFTKAHELGHYFLNHQLEEGNVISCQINSVSEKNSQPLPRIETEANYFATYFLMPEQLMLKEFEIITDIFKIDTSRPLYIDHQASNYKNWRFISRHFVQRFGVSKEALGYRLEALNKIYYKL